MKMTYPPKTGRDRDPIDIVGRIIVVLCIGVLAIQIAVPLILRAW